MYVHALKFIHVHDDAASNTHTCASLCCFFADLIALFTLPKVYETYKEQIDAGVKTFVTRVQETMTQ